MTATTIAITNNKGGVGKTTLTLNLAVALVASGYNVTIIDMDPQGHISVSLDIVDEYGLPLDGVYDVLLNKKSLDDILLPAPPDEYEPVAKVPDGKLWVLPGGEKTQIAAMELQMQKMRVEGFAENLLPLKERSQIILLDCAPANSLFLASIFYASDYLLIPAGLNRLSITGIQQTFQQVQRLKNVAPVAVLAILPMMVQLNTREAQERLGELQEEYGNLVWDDVMLRRSSVWNSASDEARSIFSYKSTTNNSGKKQAEAQMWAVAEKIINRLNL